MEKHRWEHSEKRRRREKIKKDKDLRRKKIHTREKVEKLRSTVFFQWFVAPEGRKVGSLKRRVRSQLARWEMQNCTPLWREANFEVKMYKAPQCRTTFGSCDVEKVHDVVARGIFPSQNAQNTHHSQTTFGSWDVEKVHTVVARRTFGSQNVQNTPAKDSAPSKTWEFCSISKNDGRRGTFEGDLERCILRDRRNTRDMFIRDVRRSGRWFPEMGCILEHQIFRFAKMILGDRCSTSYDLASLLRGMRSTLHGWSGKIAKRIGTRPSAVHSTFPFLKEASQNCLVFWCCQLQKVKEVSQNCFVFDVVNFENWGNLAKLLPC